MGWNSWNCLYVEVNEAQVMEIADYMAEHLLEYGYEYLVIDLGWYLSPEMTIERWQQKEPSQTIDSWGRLLPDTLKFPSAAGGKGFKPLAEYLNSKGLKLGIHIMRGIPWNAVSANTPIQGSNTTAGDVADPEDLCEWSGIMQGIHVQKPGGREYYQSIIDLYASWGVDYIKADDFSRYYHHDEIEALSEAIQSGPRPMVLSLSPGATALHAAGHVKKHAHMWRISNDLWDTWHLIRKQFDYCADWSPHAGPGSWPDADMLPLGKLRLPGEDEFVAGLLGLEKHEIVNEYSRLSPVEQHTLMNLWAIARSPLMMGGWLPDNDSLTLSLLTNASMLKVNQQSMENRVIWHSEDVSVWTAKDPVSDTCYLALFNTADEGDRDLSVSWHLTDLGTETFQCQDIWTGAVDGPIRETYTCTLSPHESKLLKIWPGKASAPR
jgi:hypothetical protein